MDIASLSRREIVTVPAGASLREAAVLMREHHVGALLVVASEGERAHAMGIVTDRDLVIEVIARGADPASLRVGELANRALVAVPAGATVREAIAVMERSGVRRLLVVDAEGGVIGFASTDDLFAALADELGGLARTLRSGIARERAGRTALAPPRPRPVFLPGGTPGMPWPAVAPAGGQGAA